MGLASFHDATLTVPSGRMYASSSFSHRGWFSRFSGMLGRVRGRIEPGSGGPIGRERSQADRLDLRRPAADRWRARLPVCGEQRDHLESWQPCHPYSEWTDFGLADESGADGFGRFSWRVRHDNRSRQFHAYGRLHLHARRTGVSVWPRRKPRWRHKLCGRTNGSARKLPSDGRFLDHHSFYLSQ